jgi:hypothetical protein
MNRIRSRRLFEGMCSAGIGVFLIFWGHTYASQESPRPSSPIESFLGIVCFVDWGSPGLDFVILTQERPGQNYGVDTVEFQCFESIWVSRQMETGQPIYTKKIKDSLIEALETRKQILIYGNYTKETAYTLGRADGYLRLTSFTIYSPEGYPHAQNRFYFEGVEGGVFGCISAPPKKKKK